MNKKEKKTLEALAKEYFPVLKAEYNEYREDDPEYDATLREHCEMSLESDFYEKGDFLSNPFFRKALVEKLENF